MPTSSGTPFPWQPAAESDPIAEDPIETLPGDFSGRVGRARRSHEPNAVDDKWLSNHGQSPADAWHRESQGEH